MLTGSYLSTRGYIVPKSCFSQQDLESLKKDLTVKPFTPEGYGPGQDENTSFQTYMESKTKLYLPKFYGLQKYGVPSIQKINKGDDIQIEFIGKLRSLQEDAVKAVWDACQDPSKMGGLLCLQCGEGKCLGKDTPILMYDGTIKLSQNIKIGDILMGDDSKPRNVLSVCRGKETMYEIIQEKGDSYIVNESHILSLKSNNNKIIDIALLDYINLPQKNLFGYKVPIDFPVQPISHDPYMIGYELSDHIPNIYKCNSREIRLQVLAGIIDANKGYNIGLMLESALNDILYLARSLGFVAHKKDNGIIIYGNDVQNIPTRINWPKQNYNLTCSIQIKKMDIDTYYGFEIDGNHRFVLGDFTVTHNTVCGIKLICDLSKKALIVVHKEFLLDQWKERIREFAPNAEIGLIKAKKIDIENKDIVIASLQSLAMKEYDKEVLESFGTLMIDECHHLGAQVFSQALKKCNFNYTIGLTATPKRKDGLTKVFKWFIGDIVYQTKKRTDELQVIFKDFYDINPEYCKEHMLYTKKPNIARMINSICEFMPRVIFVVDQICHILEEEPMRKILVLSDRRLHLQLLKDLLAKNNLDAGFYYGGLTATQLKESEEKGILLGTYNYISEGFDMKGLDTLVLASPKSDVIQVVGRILRDKPEDRKHMPLVLDIIDNFSIFLNQGQKRYNYYKKCSYKIEGFTPVSKTINLPCGKCLC